MATRFELAKVPKRHLRKATIYVERLQKECWKKYLAFIWHVDNFMKLQDTVVYTHNVQEINWDLKLKKKRSSAEVTINTTSTPFGCPWNISCYVRYDDSFLSPNTSAPFVALQVSLDSYEVRLPSSAIKSPQNYPLKHYGTLNLQFEFSERKRECFHSDRYKRDYLRPVNSDVGSILMNSIMTDFAIKPAGGRIVKCHKALLAARSIYFRDYFNESCNNGNQISVSASYDTLNVAVRYLYGFRVEEVDPKKLRDIIALMCDLVIPSFEAACNRHLPQITNEIIEYCVTDEELNQALTSITEDIVLICKYR